MTIVSDLDRALVQAPVMRLRLAAEVTDWDAELAWLEGDEAAVDEAPVEPTDSDPEAAHFRALHAKLHEADGGRRRGERRRDPHPRVRSAVPLTWADAAL